MKKLQKIKRLGLFSFLLLLSIAACKKPNEAPALTTENNAIPSKVTIQTSDSTENYQQYSIQYDSTGRVIGLRMSLTPGEKYPFSCIVSYKKDVISIDTFSSSDTSYCESYAIYTNGRPDLASFDAEGHLTSYLDKYLLTWKNGNLTEIKYLSNDTLNHIDTLHTYLDYYTDLVDRTRSVYMFHASVRHIGMPSYWFSFEPMFGKSSKNLLKSIRSSEGDIDISYQVDDNGNPIKINYHIEDVEPSSFRPTDIAHTLSYEYR